MNIFEFPSTGFLYMQGMAGDDIYINDSSTVYKAMINNLPVNRQADIRNITSTTELKRGDLITWDTEKWLILSEIGHVRYTFYKGQMRKCNFNIIFNFTGIFKTIPAIVDTKTTGINENNYYILPSGNINVYLQDITDTQDITIEQRFIIAQQPYKIIGIDKTSVGCIILTAEKDVVIADDNLTLEIANYNTWVYTLTIDNGDTANLLVSGTLQLSSTVMLNDLTVTGIDILYSAATGATGIYSLSTGGLINGLSLGSGMITALMDDKPTVNDSIIVNVTVGDNFTYELLGTGIVKYGQTQTFEAVKKNNGTVVTGVFDFSVILSTGSSSSNYTFTVIDDDTATIKCEQYLYYITLRGTDHDIPASYIDKAIQLKGLV